MALALLLGLRVASQLADGTTSMYTSTGGGVIGGGQHETVAAASMNRSKPFSGLSRPAAPATLVPPLLALAVPAPAAAELPEPQALPADYHVHNIQALGGELYVTYARIDPTPADPIWIHPLPPNRLLDRNGRRWQDPARPRGGRVGGREPAAD